MPFATSPTMLAPVTLNIARFRYVAPGFSPSELNTLNQEILIRVQQSGAAVPSQTWLDDRFAIRVCNTNHRSRRSDFDLLLAAVLGEGDELTLQAQLRPPN